MRSPATAFAAIVVAGIFLILPQSGWSTEMLEIFDPSTGEMIMAPHHKATPAYRHILVNKLIIGTSNRSEGNSLTLYYFDGLHSI